MTVYRPKARLTIPARKSVPGTECTRGARQVGSRLWSRRKRGRSMKIMERRLRLSASDVASPRRDGRKDHDRTGARSPSTPLNSAVDSRKMLGRSG